jgi:hypothetical protein
MIWLEVLSCLPCDWSAGLPWLGFRDRVRYSFAGEKRGGKEHQLRRPYHPDVHLLRIISFNQAPATNLSSLLFHGTCRASGLYVRNIPRPGQHLLKNL